MAISKGFLHDKYSFQILNEHNLPVLVILSRHVRAIVYQELYDITVAFPEVFGLEKEYYRSLLYKSYSVVVKKTLKIQI